MIESLYHNLRDFHQIFKRRNGKIFLIFFFLKNYISHKITSKAFLRFPNFSNLFPLLTTQNIFVFKNLLSILPLLSVPINGDSVFGFNKTSLSISGSPKKAWEGKSSVKNLPGSREILSQTQHFEPKIFHGTHFMHIFCENP